ncbi:MAG: glycosyltransferase [Chlorobium sp.]|nr:MAG: glycosyltransferase [Chlorobium sp.]
MYRRCGIELSRFSAVRNDSLLIIFTKNPRAGLVKTRLASTIGDEAALAVYEALRSHTASITSKVDVTSTVFYSDFIPSADIFDAADFKAQLQVGNDLGERMLHAFESGFDGGYRHIVLIGTDCYELNTAIINAAFAALEHADAVVGPARDGGFYLIGLNRFIPELFQGRQWSTSIVLIETVEILHRLAVHYELLTELSDIDTFEDLKNSGLWPSTQA